VRVIRGCILLGLRTGLASDHSRDLAAARSWAAGNALGIRLRPSQFCSTSAGDGAFFFRQRLEPTCRFARSPPRVSSIAGLAAFFGRARGRRAAAPGAWPRGVAVPCDPSIPLKLLRTGSNGFTGHDCLELRRSSRALIAGHRPPLLAAFRPWAFARDVTTDLQSSVAASRVPFGGIEGQATIRSDGVSVGPAFPYEVFAPAGMTSTGSHRCARPCGLF